MTEPGGDPVTASEAEARRRAEELDINTSTSNIARAYD